MCAAVYAAGQEPTGEALMSYPPWRSASCWACGPGEWISSQPRSAWWAFPVWQGSAMAEELHETVHSFRSRPHILIAKGRYILIFSDRHVT